MSIENHSARGRADRRAGALAEVWAGFERGDFLTPAALAGDVTGALRAEWQTAPEVWAYPATYSILPTQTLRLHLSASVAGTAATIRIYELTQWSHAAWTGNPVASTPPNLIVSRSYNGPNNTGQYAGVEDWNWTQTVEMGTTGTSWIAPGLYVADVRVAGSTAPPLATCWVPFVVRNPAANPAAAILYKLSINTMQAYNYGPPSTPADYQNSFYGGPIEVHGQIRITFRRPFTTWTVLVSMIDYNYPLVWWLRRQGYAVDFCTDVDLHLDTGGALLSKYTVVLSTGHDEYWSQEMYDHLAAYRNRGGNLMFLSGNTCCWRVEYGAVDPAWNVPTSLHCGKTPWTQDVSGAAAWWDQTATPKDNALVGAGTRNCAIRESFSVAPFSPPTPYSKGFRVQNADHWIFDGTGVANGKVIGYHDVLDTGGNPRIENLIGPEGGGARIDGLDVDGAAQLALNDGTPVNLALLGVARTDRSSADLEYAPSCWESPCTKWKVFSREGSVGSADPNSIYAATMGFYTAYGAVFTGSTMNWGNVLNEWDSNGGTYRTIPLHWQTANDPPWTSDAQGNPILGNPYLHRITRNLLDAFSDRARHVRAIIGNLLILQMKTTGEPSFWRMNGALRAAAGSILYDGSASPGRRMRIAAAASLAPGAMHLILQDTVDSHVIYWMIAQAPDGTLSRQGTGAIAPGWADPEWTLRAVIDQHLTPMPRHLLVFQHTGTPAVPATGALYFWQVDGSSWSSGAPLNPAWGGDPLWRPVASLDLDGDGRDDLLFQHETTRELYYWLLDGVNVVGAGPLGSAPTEGWYVVGAYDVSGSGQKDIVFQNVDVGAYRGTGELYYWAVTANPITGVPTAPLGSRSTMFL